MVDEKGRKLERQIANVRRLVSFLLIAIALTFSGLPSVHAHMAGPVDFQSSDHHHSDESHSAHHHGVSPEHVYTGVAGHQSDPFCCDDTGLCTTAYVPPATEQTTVPGGEGDQLPISETHLVSLATVPDAPPPRLIS